MGVTFGLTLDYSDWKLVSTHLDDSGLFVTIHKGEEFVKAEVPSLVKDIVLSLLCSMTEKNLANLQKSIELDKLTQEIEKKDTVLLPPQSIVLSDDKPTKKVTDWSSIDIDWTMKTRDIAKKYGVTYNAVLYARKRHDKNYKPKIYKKSSEQ